MTLNDSSALLLVPPALEVLAETKQKVLFTAAVCHLLLRLELSNDLAITAY